jgi:RNA polymerase sigma factor (sigma-70 family)
MGASPEAIGQLYRRQAQTLVLFFQRRVHDPELAIDLMSEAFATALDRRADYRGDNDDALSGWLWQIAQSTLQAHERRDASAREGARRLAPERRQLDDREIERVEELAGLADLREAVRHRMRRLPEDQRDAVRLRVVDGLPYEQVAERLDIDVPAARARVSRALRRLAAELEFERDQEAGQ